MNSDHDKFTPKSPGSKIPTSLSSFKRSSSVRIRGEKANLSSSVPAPSAFNDCMQHNSWQSSYDPLSFNRSRVRSSNRSVFDDDLESIGSIASNFSVATTNSTCEHASFAKNGTTYSGRSHKYIVHCSSSSNGDEKYLTPTQRANKSIKKLKSLLQLAREKLREKEEEIFKLNKEVVELKSYTKVLNSPNKNVQVVSNEIFSPFEEKLQNFSNFTTEKFTELSPIRHQSDEAHHLKISPTPYQDGLGEKASITPDVLFSSMADSGNFDDLTSSLSVYSKDSTGFIPCSEHKSNQQELSCDTPDFLSEDDKEKIIKTYEKKLEDKKLEYEMQLKQVIDKQDEKNIKMICEFENKLKEEEAKFESRWNELLKTAEHEKLKIVNRFEEKLEEEREKYRTCLAELKTLNNKISNNELEMTYSKNVSDEKTLYETSLMNIKEKFETEKCLIEKKFDETMAAERNKFEDNLKAIKQISDSQVADLTKRVSELELEYSELLPKYEKAVSQSEELEKENESLKIKLKEQEENHKKLFLTIYKKGQEAARLDLETQSAGESNSTSKKVSVSELFAQLKITEVELENLKECRDHSDNDGLCLLSPKEAISLWLLAARKAMYKRLAEAQQKVSKKEAASNDAEATLQFLKSAVYYFLTDRENHIGHLKAIESILGFSATEKTNIENVYFNRYY